MAIAAEEVHVIGTGKEPLLASRPRLQSTVSATCWLLEKLSPVPKDATPLRWRIVFVAVLVLASCVINVTMLFAFLPQMMRDLGYDEQKLGIYGGLVASSYFVGALVVSNVWGFIADVRGRRPVILVCLLGTSIFTLCFGFSFNIYWAICFRFMVGTFNGIIGTTKAILGDISDDSNQAVGCATLSAGWGFGLLVGPAIGGYLAEPSKKYAFFSRTELRLFEEFPYLLPNLLSSIACIFSFFVALALLDETKNSRAANSPKVSQLSKKSQAQSAANDPADSVDGAGRRPVDPETLVPIQAVPQSAVQNISPVLTEKTEDISFCGSLCQLFSTPGVVVATSLFSMFSLACVALDETVALWAATKTQFGGLGFSTNELGTMTGGCTCGWQ